MVNSKNYALHLEKLRQLYKITVNDICKNICTPRQYRRYKTGENRLPQTQLIKFCENLNISLNEFFYTYNERGNPDHKKMYRLYTMIRNGQYDEYLKSDFQDIRAQLVNERDIRWLDYCTEKAMYMAKRKHYYASLDSLYKIMDYPKCLYRDAYDFVDLLLLVLITEIEIKVDIDKCLLRLQSILINPSSIIISYANKSVIASVFANVSLMLGRLKRYDEALKVADKGIHFALLHHIYDSLAHLRYMRAFCLKIQGYIPESEKEAIRCIMTTITTGNTYQTKAFHNEFLKDFGFDPFDYLSKYKDELLEHK